MQKLYKGAKNRLRLSFLCILFWWITHMVDNAYVKTSNPPVVCIQTMKFVITL